MSLLMELQQRIPDRWFFQRLLPAAVFVIVAAIGGGQLGQAHWNDIGLARDRVAAALQADHGTGYGTAASLILLAGAIVVCAFALPVAAAVVAMLASGPWPWWLAPAVERIRQARIRRRKSLQRRLEAEVNRRRPQGPPPGAAGKETIAGWTAQHASLQARGEGKFLRAARIDTWSAVAGQPLPSHPTWCGDQFAAARARIASVTGIDISAAWTALKLTLDDADRAALAASRDAYDAACEAIAWSAAVTVLGLWWWPAFPAGLIMGAAAWRWLRLSVTAFCDTTVAIALLHAAGLPGPLKSSPPYGALASDFMSL